MVIIFLQVHDQYQVNGLVHLSFHLLEEVRSYNRSINKDTKEIYTGREATTDEPDR